MSWAPQSEPFASLLPSDHQRRILDHDELRDVIELTLWTAQLLLKSGAQSSRVERTGHLLGTGLGADWLDVVVMEEGLILTTSSGAEFRTRARRVSEIGVNLTTVERIASMTRQVRQGQLDRNGVRARLVELEGKGSSYPRLLVALSVGFACGAFSRLFGSDWIGFFTTCVSSTLAMLLRQELARRHYNPLMTVVATAFSAGIPPCLAHRLGILPSAEEALAASVLLLVPGVPFINAARDVLRGYLVAGIARGFRGLLISLCIALGLATALTVCGLEFDPTSAPLGKNTWDYVLTDAFWSGLAAGGFAILFNVPKRFLPICMLAGATGHALQTVMTVASLPLLPSTLLAAVGVGIVSEVFARTYRSPAGLVAVPGAIPMVPGVLAFRSMSSILNLISPKLNGDQLGSVLGEAARNFTSTGLLLASLALGIAMPSLMLKRDRVIR